MYFGYKDLFPLNKPRIIRTRANFETSTKDLRVNQVMDKTVVSSVLNLVIAYNLRAVFK